MGNFNKLNKQKDMKFALFVAAASAATLTFNDKCKTDADCPKFFNEQMRCATGYEEAPAFFGYKATGKDCTLNALCGFGKEMDGYRWRIECDKHEQTEEVEQEVLDEHFDNFVKTFSEAKEAMMATIM